MTSKYLLKSLLVLAAFCASAFGFKAAIEAKQARNSIDRDLKNLLGDNYRQTQMQDIYLANGADKTNDTF